MTLINKTLPETRRGKLRELLENLDRPVRIMEAHNGMSALIANGLEISAEDGETRSFDGIWESSLTDSASKGLPDTEIVSFDSRLQTIEQIMEVSNKPLIVDGDTGGDVVHFKYMVKRLEKAGVSAVIIEDKVFPKRNSLDGDAIQKLENIDRFCYKIQKGKETQISSEFMIIARIEALIAGCGGEEAIRRAKAYLEAGVDAIMIHSKDPKPDEILAFAANYKKLTTELGFHKPLVCVPTTYNMVTEEELYGHGFQVVIHANHFLRAAVKAMEEVGRSILVHGRSLEASALCVSTKHVFKQVGFMDVKKLDEEQQKLEAEKLEVIITGAGEPDGFADKSTPVPLLDIHGKTLLERQMEICRKNKLSHISMVRGYKKEAFEVVNIDYIDNDNFENTNALQSLMLAKEKMSNGFVCFFGDILFEEKILHELLAISDKDIVVVADNSYLQHHEQISRRLDLITARHKDLRHRQFLSRGDNQVSRIGQKIDRSNAQYEFIGMAYFSPEGASQLISIYEELAAKHEGPFHEQESFQQAKFADILQEMIERGMDVSLLEIHKGWVEIHEEKDLAYARDTFKAL